MSGSKSQKVAKAAGESFSVGAGIASFVFDVVSSIFKIPQAFQWIKWAVSSLIGCIAGCFSGREALKKANAAEAVALQKQQEEAAKPSTSVIFSAMDSPSTLRADAKDAKYQDDSLRIEVLHIPKAHSSNDRFFKDEKKPILHGWERSDEKEFYLGMRL